jgi:hypothetical protein
LYGTEGFGGIVYVSLMRPKNRPGATASVTDTVTSGRCCDGPEGRPVTARWVFLALMGAAFVSACGGPTSDPRSRVSRERVDRSEVPVLFAEVPQIRGGGTLRVAGTNLGVVTWRTIDNITLALDHDVLVATRGLGFDLMSADVAGTRAALAGATGEYSLFHSYLDGENQTQFRSFLCTMAAPVPEAIVIFERSHQTLRHDETCYALGLTIENQYWTGDGLVWKSRQWISEGLGYVITERLVR